MSKFIDVDELFERFEKLAKQRERRNLCANDTFDIILDIICEMPCVEMATKKEHDELFRQYMLACAERDANVKGMLEMIQRLEAKNAELCREIDRLLNKKKGGEVE